MKKEFKNLLASYIDALHPIIYINHFDFKVIDDTLSVIGSGVNIVEYNNALGIVDFNTKSPIMECSLDKFLLDNMDEGYENQTFIVLKDIHNALDDPKIIALLKRISEDNLYRENYNATIFIVSSKVVIPIELENYITVFDIPLPTNKEIVEIINNFKESLDLKVDDNVLNDIALSFKGLNEFQIKQILNLAYQDGGYIDEEDKYLILQEKEQFIKKSGMLEMVNFKESIDDIGGLENLKDWLYRKSKI